MSASMHTVSHVFHAECTPLGGFGIVATERGVCWAAFDTDLHALRAQAQRAFPNTILIEDAPAMERFMRPIQRYLHAHSTTLAVPFDTHASAFCETVWRALRRIPYGQTCSYTEVAVMIGLPQAVRAVAHACAKNPIALMTPCHRVIQKNGHLGGYRWGVKRKAALLALEAQKNGSMAPPVDGPTH